MIWNGFAWISTDKNKYNNLKKGPNGNIISTTQNELAAKRSATVLAANHRALGQALAAATLANPFSLISGGGVQNAIKTPLIGNKNSNLNGNNENVINGSNNNDFIKAQSQANNAVKQQINKFFHLNS